MLNTTKQSPVRFNQHPICEVCGDELAVSFSALRDLDKPREYRWQFTGYCTANQEIYYIEFTRFFREPTATIDWLAQLSEKTWFNPENFFQMVHRFRKATNSFCAC